MHLQKATNRGMLDFCFAGKLPFSPLIEIKSGLWYASAEGRKAHFLHICVEKRCPGPSEPEKTARFKAQEGERAWFSLHTLFHLHSVLIGSTLWDGCEQVDSLLPPDSCHLYRVCRAVKQQRARRLVWSLFTQAGWEIKHLQCGLRSDWDESKWHQNQNHQVNERLTESVQLIKMLPSCDSLYCFSLKETRLSLCKWSWQIRHVNAWRCSRKSNLTFFFSWWCFGKNLFKKPLNWRLCIIPEECLRL